jgi:hypothetical protein
VTVRVSGDVGGEVGGGGDASAGGGGEEEGGALGNRSSVVRRGCRCDAGYVGARCHLFLDSLESEKVERATHWCLAPWRGAPEDGAPVAVVPCSRHPKTGLHQQWELERGGGGGGGGGPLLVVLRSQPGLCLTAPPLHSK